MKLWPRVSRHYGAAIGCRIPAGRRQGLGRDVRVEHQVKLADFTQWLERNGRSPREAFSGRIAIYTGYARKLVDVRGWSELLPHGHYYVRHNAKLDIKRRNTAKTLGRRRIAIHYPQDNTTVAQAR